MQKQNYAPEEMWVCIRILPHEQFGGGVFVEQNPNLLASQVQKEGINYLMGGQPLAAPATCLFR